RPRLTGRCCAAAALCSTRRTPAAPWRAAHPTVPAPQARGRMQFVPSFSLAGAAPPPRSPPARFHVRPPAGSSPACRPAQCPARRRIPAGLRGSRRREFPLPCSPPPDWDRVPIAASARGRRGLRLSPAPVLDCSRAPSSRPLRASVLDHLCLVPAQAAGQALPAELAAAAGAYDRFAQAAATLSRLSCRECVALSHNPPPAARRGSSSSIFSLIACNSPIRAARVLEPGVAT